MRWLRWSCEASRRDEAAGSWGGSGRHGLACDARGMASRREGTRRLPWIQRCRAGIERVMRKKPWIHIEKKLVMLRVRWLKKKLVMVVAKHDERSMQAICQWKTLATLLHAILHFGRSCESAARMGIQKVSRKEMLADSSSNILHWPLPASGAMAQSTHLRLHFLPFLLFFQLAQDK